MISIKTAIELKRAGLQWTPKLHDFFAIPHVDLDERLFVITDMMAELAVLKGFPAITFNGAVEWALDYILQTEAVWVPTDEQLRYQLDKHTPTIKLVSGTENCRCTVRWHMKPHTTQAKTASEAYAAALLYLMQEIAYQEHDDHHGR